MVLYLRFYVKLMYGKGVIELFIVKIWFGILKKSMYIIKICVWVVFIN